MNSEQRRERIGALMAQGINVPATVYADLEKDVPSAQTRRWSWWAHLWDRPHSIPGAENALSSAQEAWDSSERFVEGRQALRAEREAREAAAQQERDAEATKRDAEKQEQLTKKLRTGYFSIPGATEAGFQQALPELLERHRVDAAMAGVGDIESPLSRREILG